MSSYLDEKRVFRGRKRKGVGKWLKDCWLVSGSTKSPTLNTVKHLAEALDCTVEELLDYEDGVAPYFLDKKTATIAQELKENKELKILLDATRDLSAEELNTVINMVNMLKRK